MRREPTKLSTTCIDQREKATKGKGKPKGKGKKGKGKKGDKKGKDAESNKGKFGVDIICHKCGGRDHYAKYCPSAYFADFCEKAEPGSPGGELGTFFVEYAEHVLTETVCHPTLVFSGAYLTHGVCDGGAPVTVCGIEWAENYPLGSSKTVTARFYKPNAYFPAAARGRCFFFFIPLTIGLRLAPTYLARLRLNARPPELNARAIFFSAHHHIQPRPRATM